MTTTWIANKLPDGEITFSPLGAASALNLGGTSSGRQPLFRMDSLDRDAVRAVDPLWPDVFPLWGELPDGVELRRGDEVIARVFPCKESQRSTLDLSIEGYELIIEQHGIDDDGTTDGRWTSEGAAAVCAVMADMPPATGLRGWRGEQETRLRQAESAGRAHGMSAEEIGALTGRPYVARRSLLPACSAAKRLDEQARVAEESAREAAAQAEVARVESERPKTLRELGIEVISVNRARSNSSRIEKTLRGTPILSPDLLPYEQAALLWEDETHVFFGFKIIESLDLPVFDHMGIRVLSRDEIARSGMPVRAPTMHDARFAKQMRAKHGKGYELGPIARERFSDRGVERARELMKTWGRTLAAGWSADAWRGPWLVEAVVRGCLVSPTEAAPMLIEAAERMIARSGMPALVRGESPHWSEHPLSDQAVGFAMRGEISAGALLEPSAPAKKGRK